MNLRIYLFAACLEIVAADAAGCEHPSLVQIPQASAISWNKYETLRPEIEAYLELMNTYVECTRSEIDETGEKARTSSLLEARVSGALTEMQSMVAAYNALLRELGEIQRAGATP